MVMVMVMVFMVELFHDGVLSVELMVATRFGLANYFATRFGSKKQSLNTDLLVYHCYSKYILFGFG